MNATHATLTAKGLSLFGPDNTRWRLAATLMLSLFIGYLDRINISLAMPLIAQENGWSVDEMRRNGGDLMTFFYVGYGLANIFLTPIAAKFGPRRSLVVIVILWSLFTALGAWASSVLTLFIATRVLLGLSEGTHFPMMNTLTKRWFVPSERGRANALWIAGLMSAIAFGPVILVPLMDAFGWRFVFFALAGAGVLLSIPTILKFVHDCPKDHPAITSAERAYIEAGVDAELVETGGRKAFWKALLSGNLLLLLGIGMLNNVVAYGVSGWLPAYFVQSKGLPYEDLVYAASLPFASGVVGLFVWSWLGDRYSIRSLLAMVGFLASAVTIYMAFAAPGITEAMIWFSLGSFAISAYPACEFALIQRAVAENVIGPVSGVYNGLATLVGGGLGPVIVGFALTEGGADLNNVMMISLACFAAAVVLFVVYRRLRY